mgnify:CR=1 FL=1
MVYGNVYLGLLWNKKHIENMSVFFFAVAKSKAQWWFCFLIP